MANTVEVQSTGKVLIQQISEQAIEIQAPGTPLTIEVNTAGPAGIGIPTGGDPGNVLLKSSYANYESEWSPVVDGGTFT